MRRASEGGHMRKFTTTLLAALLLAACGGGLFGADGEMTVTTEAAVETTVTTVTTVVVSTTGAQSTPATSAASTTTAEGSSETDDVAPVTSTTRPAPTTTTTTEGDEMAGTGEVPDDLMASVLADAETRTGLDRSDMTVLRAEAVTWQDGSLGCPEPGMSYTQALVDGYWVELVADGETLDYRLSSDGGVKFCAGGGSEPLPRSDT